MPLISSSRSGHSGRAHENTSLSRTPSNSQSRRGLLVNLSSELMHRVLHWLLPEEAHRALLSPLDREFRSHVSDDLHLWRALCASEPWCMPRAYLDGVCMCTVSRTLAAETPTDSVTSSGGQSHRVMPTKKALRCQSSACAARAQQREHGLVVKQLRRIRNQPPLLPTQPVSPMRSCPESAFDFVPNRASSNGARGDSRGGNSVLDFGSLDLLGDAARVHEVAEAMCAFPHVKGLQEVCLEASRNLLAHEPSRRVAHHSNMGCALVAALRNFPEEVRLQTSALHALVLLARPLGGREGAVHTGRAPSLPALQGPLGGIVSVLECMARHLSQSPIQAMGCWAMVNFSLQPDYKAQLLQEKALPLILRALQTHASHQEVQFRGLFALINFVVPDEPPQAKDEFVEDVVSHVLRAMEQFMCDAKLVNRGCLVLQNLSLNVHNHPILCSSHARDTLEAVVSAHPHHDSVIVRSAQATLWRLFGELLPLPTPLIPTAQVGGDAPSATSHPLAVSTTSTSPHMPHILIPRMP